MKSISIIFSLLVFGLFSSCENNQNEGNGKSYKIESDTIKENTLLRANYFNKLRDSYIQEFEIDLTKEQIIKGKKGTIISFPRYFINCRSKIVTVKLIECFDVKDLIIFQLNTVTSDEKPLETDGMIYLEILDDENNIIQSTKKSLEIKIPKKRKVKGMRLFYGQRDSIQGVKWEDGNFSFDSKEKVIISTSDLDDNDDVILWEGNREVYEFYSFITKSLGWFNIDKYLNPSLEEVTLKIKTSVFNQYINFDLIFENKSYLSFFKDKANSSLKKSIPLITQNATLLSYYFKEDKLFFDKRQINLSAENDIDLGEFKVLEYNKLDSLISSVYWNIK